MVSIIIPTHNRDKYIRECILSVLKNSFQDFEIIVVDDGSTDKTNEIVKKIKDPRIRLIKQKRLGPGPARNKGIDLAKGEYLFFLDSDDTINQDTLAVLVKNIQNNDIVIGNYKIIYDNGEVEEFINPDDCNFNAFFESVTVWHRLYRTSFLKNNKIRFKRIFQGEDRIFLAELYLKNPKFSVLDKSIYNWLRHEADEDETITHIKDHSHFDGQVKCMIRFKKMLEKHLKSEEEKKKLLDHLRYSCCYLLDILKNSDYEKCNFNKFKCFVKSLKFEENKDLFKKIFDKEMEI